MFSHEIVPDYLRTKPDPEVEEQEKQLSAEATRIGPEVAQVRYLFILTHVKALSNFTVQKCRNPTFALLILTGDIFSQQKQIQTLNKLCSNLLEKLNNPRDDRDAESAGMYMVSLCTFILSCKT